MHCGDRHLKLRGPGYGICIWVGFTSHQLSYHNASLALERSAKLEAPHLKGINEIELGIAGNGNMRTRYPLMKPKGCSSVIMSLNVAMYFRFRVRTIDLSLDHRKSTLPLWRIAKRVWCPQIVELNLLAERQRHIDYWANRKAHHWVFETPLQNPRKKTPEFEIK